MPTRTLGKRRATKIRDGNIPCSAADGIPGGSKRRWKPKSANYSVDILMDTTHRKNSTQVHMSGWQQTFWQPNIEILKLSSRENSPEIRRRNFPVNHAQNRNFLTPSPLVSPYGSRSNSPARNLSGGQSGAGASPNFSRRAGDRGHSGSDKWAMSRGKSIGQSPLAMRKQITSPVPKTTPPSPLAVPNNLGKVSTYPFDVMLKEQRPHDVFNYQIETWSNDQWKDPQHHHHQRHHSHHHQGELFLQSAMTRSHSNSSFLTRSQSSYGPGGSSGQATSESGGFGAWGSNHHFGYDAREHSRSREMLKKSVSPPASYHPHPKNSSFFVDSTFESPLTKSYSNPNIFSFYENHDQSRSIGAADRFPDRSTSPSFEFFTQQGHTGANATQGAREQSQNNNSFFSNLAMSPPAQNSPSATAFVSGLYQGRKATNFFELWLFQRLKIIQNFMENFDCTWYEPFVTETCKKVY